MGPAHPTVDTAARQRLTARFGGIKAWLDGAPALLTALAERWRLELGAAIPRGSVSLVFRCRTAGGQAAVLKVSPDGARIAAEATALRGWDGAHTAAVLADDERLGALLIEAIEPGTPLDVSLAHPAPELVADLLLALHASPVRDLSHPPLEQRIASLFDSSARLYARHPELTTRIPPGLYENIFNGGPERSLVAIDPAPCLGDAAFDASDLILWQADDRRAIAARRPVWMPGGCSAGAPPSPQ